MTWLYSLIPPSDAGLGVQLLSVAVILVLVSVIALDVGLVAVSLFKREMPRR